MGVFSHESLAIESIFKLFEEKNIDSTLVISSFRKYQRKLNYLLNHFSL